MSPFWQWKQAFPWSHQPSSTIVSQSSQERQACDLPCYCKGDSSTQWSLLEARREIWPLVWSWRRCCKGKDLTGPSPARSWDAQNPVWNRERACTPRSRRSTSSTASLWVTFSFCWPSWFGGLGRCPHVEQPSWLEQHVGCSAKPKPDQSSNEFV